jgi:hypothetical protein
MQFFLKKYSIGFGGLSDVWRCQDGSARLRCYAPIQSPERVQREPRRHGAGFQCPCSVDKLPSLSHKMTVTSIKAPYGISMDASRKIFFFF